LDTNVAGVHFTLNMETALTSETLISYHNTARRCVTTQKTLTSIFTALKASNFARNIVDVTVLADYISSRNISATSSCSDGR
jgi:capsule polysaccharide export protein KpsE/RkpR